MLVVVCVYMILKLQFTLPGNFFKKVITLRIFCIPHDIALWITILPIQDRFLH